jgi:hypothetical protein
MQKGEKDSGQNSDQRIKRDCLHKIHVLFHGKYQEGRGCVADMLMSTENWSIKSAYLSQSRQEIGY